MKKATLPNLLFIFLTSLSLELWMNYVGIDLHLQYSHVTVMDQRGQVLRSGREANLQSEIERFLEGLEAMEAVLFALGGKSRVHRLSINLSYLDKEGITAPSSCQLHGIEPTRLLAGG